MNRADDFEERRSHLKNLSDEALKQRFWDLTEQIVSPLADLAKTHTSPSIERSVLLRMGFSSIEAKALVELVMIHHLMGKGAGHVVYRASLLLGCSISEAGKELLSGHLWESVIESFEVKR